MNSLIKPSKQGDSNLKPYPIEIEQEMKNSSKVFQRKISDVMQQ